MCQTDEKRRGRFFGRLVSFPNQNPQRALLVAFVSFLLFFLRFFVFLSSRSEYSFVALLVGRARVYISRNARSRRVSRETRREKEREGKKTTCTRDDDPGGKREEEERKIESFFRSGRLRESERRREKEREETRLSSSFQTI